MPIAFVDRQLNDNSRLVDPLLAETAPSSCRSTVKSGSSPRHFLFTNRSWQTPCITLSKSLIGFDSHHCSFGEIGRSQMKHGQSTFCNAVLLDLLWNWSSIDLFKFWNSTKIFSQLAKLKMMLACTITNEKWEDEWFLFIIFRKLSRICLWGQQNQRSGLRFLTKTISFVARFCTKWTRMKSWKAGLANRKASNKFHGNAVGLTQARKCRIMLSTRNKNG